MIRCYYWPRCSELVSYFLYISINNSLLGGKRFCSTQLFVQITDGSKRFASRIDILGAFVLAIRMTTVARGVSRVLVSARHSSRIIDKRAQKT